MPVIRIDPTPVEHGDGIFHDYPLDAGVAAPTTSSTAANGSNEYPAYDHAATLRKKARTTRCVRWGILVSIVVCAMIFMAAIARSHDDHTAGKAPSSSSNNANVVGGGGSCTGPRGVYVTCLRETFGQAAAQSCYDCTMSLIEELTQSPELVAISVTHPEQFCTELTRATSSTSNHAGFCTRVLEECPCNHRYCYTELKEWTSCFTEHDCDLSCTELDDNPVATSTDGMDEETATPEPPTCDKERDRANQCLATLSGINAANCASCYHFARGASIFDTCEDAQDAFCGVFELCQCGPCTQSIEELVDCYVAERCLSDCDGGTAADPMDGGAVGNGTVTTNSTETSLVNGYEDTCAIEMTVAGRCLSRAMSGKQGNMVLEDSCINCFMEAYTDSAEYGCHRFQNNFCPDLWRCRDCELCYHEMEQVANCMHGVDCDLDCNLAQRIDNKEPVCVMEYIILNRCMAQSLSSSQADACLSCVESSVEEADFLTCDEMHREMCDLFGLCECGDCLDEVQTYLDCRNGETCPLNCISSANHHPGGPNDNDSTDCAVQESDYNRCLSTMDRTKIASCIQCTTSAYERSSKFSCQALTQDFCPLFQQCDCAACETEIKELLACSKVGPDCIVTC